MKVLSVLDVLPPKTVCTETYLVVGLFDNKEDALKLKEYLKTKFVRFLIAQSLASMNMSKGSFIFVPKPNLSIDYSDEYLYSLYSLTPEEIKTVEDSINPMTKK